MQGQVTGRLGSFYELLSGKDQWSGEELSEAGRIVAGIEIILGTPKVFKVLGTIVGVGALGKNAAKIHKASENLFETASKHGFIKALNPRKKTDLVLIEIFSGKGNLTRKFSLKADEALEAGIKWVGPEYKEIGKSGSGVFRSKDGLRQFRMDKTSIVGNHAPNTPHIHFETYQSGAKRFEANNHVPFPD